MAIFETNAAVERTFSNINILWSDEKNCFLINTMKATIIVKNYSYNEFYSSHIHGQCAVIKYVKQVAYTLLPNK